MTKKFNPNQRSREQRLLDTFNDRADERKESRRRSRRPNGHGHRICGHMSQAVNDNNEVRMKPAGYRSTWDMVRDLLDNTHITVLRNPFSDVQAFVNGAAINMREMTIVLENIPENARDTVRTINLIPNRYDVYMELGNRQVMARLMAIPAQLHPEGIILALEQTRRRIQNDICNESMITSEYIPAPPIAETVLAANPVAPEFRPSSVPRRIWVGLAEVCAEQFVSQPDSILCLSPEYVPAMRKALPNHAQRIHPDPAYSGTKIFRVVPRR